MVVRFPKDMLPKELEYLRSMMPCEERGNVYEQIIILYSKYMTDTRLLREQLSEEIDAAINMPTE